MPESIDKDRLREAEELIYRAQRERIERMYSDIHDLGAARRLFFEKVYPPPGERHRYEKRDRAFVRMTRNRLLRLICSQRVIAILEEVVELKESNDRFNREMARGLAARDTLPDRLSEQEYIDLSRSVSTYPERIRQVQCALDGFILGLKVVLHFPLDLNQIIRYVPRRLLGDRELFELAVDIYNAFYSHRDRLYDELELLREREANRLKEIFDIPDDEAIRPVSRLEKSG